MMQQSAQAVEVRARGSLRFAILLRGGVARRAKRGGILCAPRPEVPRDAKIDQADMLHAAAHDVSRFKIAKDDGWLLIVQVLKYVAKLEGQRENFFEGQQTRRSRPCVAALSLAVLQVASQRLAFQKLHHQVPV